ncbi:MAG: serine hydrolase [Acidobacteriota bacterium]|nr:MAG: serine hydrolase [Acidobacteriota bacterium]
MKITRFVTGKSGKLIPALILLAMSAVFFRPASGIDAASPVQSMGERIRRIEEGLLPAVLVKGLEQRWRISDRMAHHKVPGVSLAVINNSRIEWSKSFGIREAGKDEPVVLETLFQAASISKPVAAMGALWLVEKNRLSLDEDVNRRLRSWQVPENDLLREKKVTLRGLVNHSAGLTVHGFRGYAADEQVPSLTQVLNGEKPANSAPIRVDLEPGTRWRYSGGGYTVMQQLMIDVTRTPFPKFMRDNVLRKLGMKNSTYEQPLPAELRANAAIGHRRNGQPIKGSWHTYPEMAAAGLWTTPNDLAKFAVSIIKGLTGGRNGVLSNAMTRQMVTKVLGDYGLGLGVSYGPDGRILSFGHGGSNEGFKCQMIAFPETGQGAVVMTNGDLGSMLADEILRALAVEYNWPARKPVEKSIVALESSILDRYTGKYEVQPGFIVEIKSMGGRLWAVVPQQGTVELLAESETKFFSINGETPTLEFAHDPRTGETELIVMQGGEMRRLKRRN